ncbi:uncharacterized protein LOC141619760 [Silene latifolia]|uniref:uncharacterized protein LOC141619760 n=1 Tax=Silene latifolia TaxID=37657 RepID=UPI003D771AEE
MLLGSATEVKPVNRRVVKAGQRLTEDHCLLLTAPITDDEVKIAMFDIPGTKVLCNRIGNVLPDIISPSQGAFIKGRDIGNILICQDLIKLYKRKRCSPRVLIKVDLQKRYDSVAWSFVLEMLQATGFPESFIRILMQCITTPTYSLSLNGETFGFFKGRRGLRGDRGSVGLMVSAFDHFSKASGLVMNSRKSNFYYNGIDVGLVNEIEQQTGMKKGQARIFILPKAVIGKIEAVCRSYLWYGSNHRESPALFSWATICQPKKQGGLGFKDLHTWNVAAIEKYVWWVTMKADHLWVQWVHAMYIKNTAWKDYEPGSGSSWAWRKICQVKNIYKAKLFSGANVEHYTLKEGYQWLRPVGDKVVWYPWVLNRMIIPRHAFLCWLVAQKRLLTQDRLIKMQVIQANCCYLCGEMLECHDHLFFQCRYSRICLELTACWCMVDLPDNN